MAVIIPQAVQVTVSGTYLGSETWAHVWHVSKGTGGVGYTEASAIYTELRAWLTDIRGQRHTSWIPTRATVRDISVVGAETFQFESIALPGTSGGSPLPAQCSAVATLRSATNSRRGRGRTYLGPLVNSSMGVGTGQFTQAFCTTEAQALADFGSGLRAIGFDLAIASRVGGQLYGVQTVTVNSVPDTQRRRTRELSPQFTQLAEVV